MVPEILQTRRLVLRRFRAADWPAIHAVQTDPARGYWVRGPFLEASEERSRAGARRMARNWDELGWGPHALILAGATVGYAGLRSGRLEERTEVEALWGLHADARGAGLVAEAMHAILAHPLPKGVTSVASWALPGNRPSIAIMKRLGFRYERNAVYAELPHAVYRWTV